MNTEFMLNVVNGIDEELIDEYFKIGKEVKVKNKVKAKPKGQWLKLCSIAACLCLIVGATVLAVYIIQNREQINSDSIPQTNIASDTLENDNVTQEGVDNDYVDSFQEWYGKTVSFTLENALKTADVNDQIEIYANHGIGNSSSLFVYKGKTLEEYAIESNRLYLLIIKLEMLIKQGDALKYGELLYTTGTPDGEKWTKELYDETTAYYGKEILDKYIIDGEFLLNALMLDLEQIPNEVDAVDAVFEEGMNEYMRYAGSAAKQALEAQNIECELSSTGYDLVFSVTAEQFKNLTLENIDEWGFYMAREMSIYNNNNNSNSDIPLPDIEDDVNAEIE